MASPHPSPRMYVNPVPGGTVGRTDQGVDISAPPGTPVLAIAREKLIGIIPNWYAGQPFLWFQELGTNTYNYVAEQISSRLQPGDVVEQGQEIGTVAEHGTGLELGFATSSGQTLARATTGYTEGEATPAGQRYRAEVIQGGGIVRPGGQPVDSSGNPTAPASGSGPSQIFSNYLSLRDMPRTAPPGTKNPFAWWAASFTGNWDALGVSASTAATTPSSSSGGVGSTPGGGYTPHTWAVALLNALGVPPTSQAVSNILAWETQEGGNWNNSAKFNPLNTSQDASGATSINADGVKAYTSWEQGLNATVQTLRSGRYGGILAALGGNQLMFKQAVNSSPWGTVFN